MKKLTHTLLATLLALTVVGMSGCETVPDSYQIWTQIGDATEGYILYADTAEKQSVRATRIIAYANAYEQAVDDLVAGSEVKLSAEFLTKVGEQVLDRLYTLTDVERNRALFVIRKVAELVAPRIKGIPVPEDQLALLSQAVADIKAKASLYQ